MTEVSQLFELLEERLAVLARLAESLSPANARTPEAQILFLEHRSVTQRGLLADWARIEGAIEPWRRRLPDFFAVRFEGSGLTGGASAEVQGHEIQDREIRERCLAYRAQYLDLLQVLQAKCRVEASVLRRSRRTASALSSMLAGSESAYAFPPPGAPTSRLRR